LSCFRRLPPIGKYSCYVNPPSANLASMTRIGTQKMQKIIQLLFNILPEAVNICTTAKYLIPYIKEDTFTDFPPLLGQQIALRPQLTLIETFTPIRSTEIETIQDSSD